MSKTIQLQLTARPTLTELRERVQRRERVMRVSAASVIREDRDAR